MTMKQLPVEGESMKKVCPAKSASHQYLSREDICSLIKKRLHLKEISNDEKIIDKACYKMIRYVTEGNNFTLEDIQDLLHYLQRSILMIQKKKKRIVEKKHKNL